MSSPQQHPGVNVLQIEGRIYSGEELEEYCKSHGLCQRCARVRTHRRVLKLFGRGEKWEPWTLHDEETGEYTVYKGYCLKDTCFTLGQAKRLLGETNNNSNGGSGSPGGKRHSRSAGGRKRASQRLLANKGIGAGIKRPGRRKPRSNPETGSVMSGMSNIHDDDGSVNSSMSGISVGSVMSNSSILSGISNISGMSGFSFGMGRRKASGGGGRRGSRRSSSNFSSASSVGSGISDTSGLEDDEITVDSTMSSTSGALKMEKPSDGEISPIVAHRVEQLMTHDYFTILDLTGVVMRPEDIDAVANALGKAKTLESLSMDKCKLKDDGVEKIASGLEAGGHTNIRKISLRGNNIGIRGVQALEFLYQSSTALEELDLSENAITSKGFAAILAAFHKNRQCVLSVLNLSQNEIWDMEDGAFLRTTATLKELNLDGNFFHDEGAEQIAKAISSNRTCMLEKLQLGWNGIADDGATALAKMIELNQSLQVLGLAENDITNLGARAILSALAVNNTLREISGLYHNQIDRKFIIVAIKRLLHRYGERTGVFADEQAQLISSAHESSFEGPVSAAPSSGPKQGRPSRVYEESKVTEDEENSRASVESTNWASAFYKDDDAYEPPSPKYYTTKKTNVALEAIENWDWGTFGIEEIEKAELQNDGLQMADFDNSDDEEKSSIEAASVPIHQPPTTKPLLPRDRIVVFQSAPLAYFDHTTTQHHEVPLLDFKYESSSICEALADTDAVGADIDIIFQNATYERFQNFFSKALSPIMHFSCFGHKDYVALENGFGYVQSLSEEELINCVSAAQGKVEVVVISSCHAEQMAKAFLKSGIPHVVCLNRDATFRDEAVMEFAKSFYLSLAKMKTLQEAFDAAVLHTKSSDAVTSPKNYSKDFRLLPEGANHHLDVFYKRTLPKAPKSEDPVDLRMLPKVPDNFVGREVDMYEILETLRVDDVIRVGGGPGSGKATVLSALSRYILERPGSFQINSVFWLPPPGGVDADPDSLYGDLFQVLKWILEAEDDIWDDENYIEARERILIELEDQRAILVVDGRVFTSEIAGEMLERFLTYLLNEATLKIILITATDSTRAKTRHSRSEETMVHMGPLDFKSSALLFGSACPFVSINGNPIVRTAEEFRSYMVPPSVAQQVSESEEKKSKRSNRQQKLYDLMGRGNPKDIVDAASSYSERELLDLLRLAKRPEVAVKSAVELEAERNKYTKAKEEAIGSKNFLRAKYFLETLQEMELLRETYPTIEDLLQKEAEYKKKFSELLKAKRYDDANLVKRKILSIKRKMMKERHSSPESAQAKARKSIQLLEERMENFKALQESNMNGQSATINLQKASLNISATCTIQIHCGSLPDFSRPDGLCGLIFWTNEACDLTVSETGKSLLSKGGPMLEEQLAAVDIICDTEWGSVKCATGEAVSLGPVVFDGACAKFVVLAVPPLSPSNDDTEWDLDVNGDSNKLAEQDALHYLDTGLRAVMRSSFRKINIAGVEAVALCTITTKPQGKAYQRSLKVALDSIVEESKRTSVKNVHLIATSGEEVNLLINMAMDAGLTLS